MCGIAGIMTSGGKPPENAFLDKMIETLRHRGPDGEGKHVFGNTALLQTRLAIIDLETGSQPLLIPSDNPNFPLSLVANGEIYNFVELKEKIIANFKTESDCEPVLFLYEKKGLNFVKDLRGMYALAIHDSNKKRLILTRDRFGIKPLYYCYTKIGFVFASEFQSFMNTGLLERKVRTFANEELLQIQFTTGRETILEGVYRVLPGETLVVEDGEIVENLFLDSRPQTTINSYTDFEAIAKLDAVLEDSVFVHQRSDVPYGMFLSGGVDSSALLAMMTRLNDNPVDAFTAGFSGTMVDDERAHARKVASSMGAIHHEVEFSESDFWALLPEIIAVIDDPVADYAILPTYKLAAEAKLMGIKVVLSGEGADETFAGYSRYRRALRPKLLGGRKMRGRGIFSGLGILKDETKRWRLGIERTEKDLNPKLTKLQQIQALDYSDWLPNDLMTKLDRCLMAHGVEGRVPFLDCKVVNFSHQLEDNLKIRNWNGKWILRAWLHHIFPESQAFSRKRGFTVPVGEWIAAKSKQLAPLVSKQNGIVETCNRETVRLLFENLSGRDKRLNKAAWSILFYSLWHSYHIMGYRNEGNIFDVLSAS